MLCDFSFINFLSAPQGPIEFETLLIVINALESCVYFIVLI